MGIRCLAWSSAGLLGWLSGAVSAQPLDANFAVPALDRWMYTFGSEPGVEPEATVFSVLGSAFEGTFDIRDGQFLVGYQTGTQVTPGQGVTRYRVLSASVVARISRDRVFRYDPTFDALETYLPQSDPAYVPDTDAARPIELHAVGYRNGLSVFSFQETTPFSFGNPVQKRVRNAFAAQYQNADGTGPLVDISNNCYEEAGYPRFESRPFSVGRCPLAPGAEVDINTDFTFEIDLTDPGAIRYVREGLNAGRLNFMITSLAATVQQSSVTPSFYTKEYPAEIGGVPARLNIRVCVGAPADWNCSGMATVQDVFDYLSDYFVGRGDFNADGRTSVQDIFDYLAAYFGA